MSYYAKGQHGDGIHDFDAYDTTPYGGGYDISLTYGRSLPPSENICYHVTSSTSDNFDYNRPQYTSQAQPSAYAPQALENEYNSYSRPKTRPGYGSASGGAHYEKPQANYQFQPGMNHPTGGGGGGEYEVPSSGYGNKSGSEYKKHGSEYGSGYGGKSDHEKHGKKSDDKYKKSSYKKRDDDSDDSDDDHKDHHGRKKHGKKDSDDSDDEKKNRHKHQHQHQHHRKHYDD